MSRGFLGLLLGVVVAGLAVGTGIAATRPSPAPTIQSLALPQAQTGASANQMQGGGTRSSQQNGNAAISQGGLPGQDRNRVQVPAQGGAEGRSRAITGSVVSVEGDLATVTTQQGEVKVRLSEAKIQKTVEGTTDDLKAGQRVMVSGQQGSDGSYTASSVQILPAGEIPGQPGLGPTPSTIPTPGSPSR